MAPWIRKLRAGRPAVLSPAAMETLAVVAYRQPLVKAEVDRIRGVDAGGTLKGLLDKKLVRIVGRKDVPGKPIIYGTTRKFLELFNLKDLTDLPTLRELKDLQESEGHPGPQVQQELRELLEPPGEPEPQETQIQREPPETQGRRGLQEPQGEQEPPGPRGGQEREALQGEREPQEQPE